MNSFVIALSFVNGESRFGSSSGGSFPIGRAEISKRVGAPFVAGMVWEECCRKVHYQPIDKVSLVLGARAGLAAYFMARLGRKRAAVD